MIRLLFIIMAFLVGCVTNRPVEDYARFTASALFNDNQDHQGYGMSASASYNWVVDASRQIWLGPEFSYMWSQSETEVENTFGDKVWLDKTRSSCYLLGGRIEFGNRTALRAGAIYEEQKVQRSYDQYGLTEKPDEHSEFGWYVGLQNDLPLSQNIFLTPALTFYVVDGKSNAVMEFGLTIGF
ncbi:MAG TPA: hypothetical protein VMW10_03700 [Alphaproteobacteria bacterium]|nr:hypothetical protein [Alphaproteobacteria bacterium]